MFAAALLALAATSAIAAPISAPSGYAHGYLEDYDTYHSRYLALDCFQQHNTTFFSDCCRPLLANENLADDRKPYCTPNATQSSSASEYEATATSTISADTEAESEYVSQSAYTESSTTSAVADAQKGYAEATSAAASTSKYVAPTTTSTSEAAATTTASSSSDVKTGGYATYFYQGGNAGACGEYNSDSSHIVAIDANGWWQDYSQTSDLCGKWVSITNTNNGKTVTAKIADVCPTCVSDNSLDLSVGAFTAIASESDGQVPITWTFV